MHLTNQTNFPQTGKHSSLRGQLTVSTPSSTVPPVPWRFLSLSLSTLVPTLPGKQQCFRLQSQGHQSVQTSVKLHCSCTLLNLRCSITHELHCKMWQLNQGHWQSKLDPPWFSCQRLSNLWQLNLVTNHSGFSCRSFSTLWQLNLATDHSGFSCQSLSTLGN